MAIDWIETELATSVLEDQRIGVRFRKLVSPLWKGVGESIPLVCQDWANTKAAYRFLSNKKFSEREILHGHFKSTKDRCDETDGAILILHDTTEFSYKREDSSGIRVTGKVALNHGRTSIKTYHTLCGILMHSSLVVTPEGLPLGLAAVKFWTRKKFKGTRALNKKINATRMPIEEKESFRWLENMRNSISMLQKPDKCVHIGDHESDIYELF